MIRIEIADTFYKKLKGLMGKKNINYGMFFPMVNSIHTYGMKENIDIVGLNDKMEITEIFRDVKMNKVIILHHSIHTLELPSNYSKDLKVGQKIDLEN